MPILPEGPELRRGSPARSEGAPGVLQPVLTSCMADGCSPGLPELLSHPEPPGEAAARAARLTRQAQLLGLLTAGLPTKHTDLVMDLARALQPATFGPQDPAALVRRIGAELAGLPPGRA
jgi:hypothetical protein